MQFTKFFHSCIVFQLSYDTWSSNRYLSQLNVVVLVHINSIQKFYVTPRNEDSITILNISDSLFA